MRVTDPTAGERAFTIVEILVGALIVTAVFAGAMYFVVGSGKTQQKSLVRQRMAAAADDISQRVRANDAWLKSNPSCKTATCDVSGMFPVPAPKPGDPELDANVRISPVDSRADTVDGKDADGVVPDFYRIEVRISMDAAEQQKWGRQNDFEAVSTVDATAIGRAVGSILVQTCEVVDQVDERMSIAGCDGSGTRREMNRQPSPCSSPFPLTWGEWLNSRPVLPLGCNNAFDAAAARGTMLSGSHIRGTTNVTFTLTRDSSDGGPATVRASADADSISGDGTHTFTGLPSGSYSITVNAGPNRELWRSKTVPSALKASVQANQEARALIVVRPRQGQGQYNARFTRAVWLYRLTTFEDTDVYTESAFGVTVQTTTHYTYLKATAPEREVWDGPAWNGIVSMEPKPFDRYRAGTVVSQPTNLVSWAPVKDPHGGWRGFGALPTGLHSLPAQQPNPSPLPPAPQGDLFGNLGTRTQQCLGGTPGGTCGPFAWLRHDSLGNADSTVTFHSEDGECYLESSVPGFAFARRLQNGGGHSERCSRDLHYRNPQTGQVTNVPNFLPDKNGNGGGVLVLSMWQETVCLNCPTPTTPSTGAVGYPTPTSTGSNPSAGPSNGPPPRTAAPPPRVTYQPPTPAPTATNPNPSPPPAQSLPAASAVPSANSGP